MNDGLGQEWMQMIVVDDFSALYNAECRSDLRRSPFPGLRYTDGNGICAIISGKRISLRRSDANLPIMREIYHILSKRTCRDIAMTATGSIGAYDFRPCPPFGKEGQKERKYEHQEFHAVQRYEKK